MSRLHDIVFIQDYLKKDRSISNNNPTTNTVVKYS